MTRPFFSRERISDFDHFTRYADRAISKLKARLPEGYAIDIQVGVSHVLLQLSQT